MICHPDPGADPAEVLSHAGLTFRLATGMRGRAALEVLSGDELLGVHVDHVFSPVLLGAVRGRNERAPWALCWGRLPPDGAVPAVAFGGGLLRHRSLPVRVARIGGCFWVAWAQGDFRTVTAASPAGAESRRLVDQRCGRWRDHRQVINGIISRLRHWL